MDFYGIVIAYPSANRAPVHNSHNEAHSQHDDCRKNQFGLSEGKFRRNQASISQKVVSVKLIGSNDVIN